MMQNRNEGCSVGMAPMAPMAPLAGPEIVGSVLRERLQPGAGDESLGYKQEEHGHVDTYFDLGMCCLEMSVQELR